METNLQYILGCINGVPTLMEIKSLSSDVCIEKSEVFIKYINVSTGEEVLGTGWFEGSCETNSIDPEVVCVSNDGGLTSSKAVAVFNTSVNPPTVELYDFNNTLLTGYTVVKCTDAGYDIEKGADFCLAGELITRYDIIDAETQLVVGSYWVDTFGVNQATPTIGDLSAWPCEQSCNLGSVGTITDWSVIL